MILQVDGVGFNLPGVEIVHSGVAAMTSCLERQPERGEARERRGGNAGEGVESEDVAMEIEEYGGDEEGGKDEGGEGMHDWGRS